MWLAWLRLTYCAQDMNKRVASFGYLHHKDRLGKAYEIEVQKGKLRFPRKMNTIKMMLLLSVIVHE